MQALLKCAGNFVVSVVEAKLPTNWDSMSPKCWEAFPQLSGMLIETMKLKCWPKDISGKNAPRKHSYIIEKKCLDQSTSLLL
jgi:hypothetical protein